MSGVNDIRSAFLDYFAKNGHEVVPSSAARAAQRPDADVHQRRHGAVQERLHRPREAALQRAPPRRRNACAPAASTTTSTMSATPRATTPSSRCWATSRFGDYFKDARDRARLGADHQGVRPAQGPAAGHRLSPRTTRRCDLWKQDRRAARRARSSASPTSDNFWAMGDTGPCGPCSEIFYDHGDHIPGGPPGLARTRTATASSRSGTSSSCSSSRSRPATRIDLPQALDRHRHGAGAHRRGAAGHARQLRHDLFRALIGAVADADRRRRRTAPQTAVAPGDRRPSARRRRS